VWRTNRLGRRVEYRVLDPGVESVHHFGTLLLGPSSTGILLMAFSRLTSPFSGAHLVCASAATAC